MKCYRFYRFELMPSELQEGQLRNFAGACRYVYNKALTINEERDMYGDQPLGSFEMGKLLTEWRRSGETAWLKEAPAAAQQQALRHLEYAYTSYFKGRAGAPKFKKKYKNDSVTFMFREEGSRGCKLDQGNSRIRLQKLGWIRYRKSREILGAIKNATVKLRCGKWFVYVRSELENQVLERGGDEPIGIDVGIKRFATMSDGAFVEPVNSFKKHEKRLRKAQQSLSRKKRRSKNWYKAVKKVAHIHARIADVRKDFLHKLSTTISKNHAVVVVEDLKIANMTRSARGTVEDPGTNVKQKSGLNRAILDQGWGMFREMLKYKLEWSGGRLIKVPPQYTSQTCPECAHVSKDNRKSQASFVCVSCGYANNADHVGAINILRAGLAQLACQANPTRGRQQELFPELHYA